MNRLFKRIAKVTAWRDTVPDAPTTYVSKPLVPGEQLEITDLRIKFRIERSLSRTPNQADIYLSNLAQTTRADLETKPLSVRLEAGYDEVPRLLFLGDLHFGMSEQKGPTWETLLQLGDGHRTYRYARCNRSYKPGTPVRTIIAEAARSMGFTLPANLAKDTSLDAQVLTGAALHGPAREELSRLLAPFGYHWSTQNGQLQVLRDDEVSGLEPLPIDQDHGMIGSPEFGSPPHSGKPPHVRVKMLLYPELTPGNLVQVTSRALSGLHRIEKVTHEGDTHGDEWITEAEIQPFDPAAMRAAARSEALKDLAKDVLDNLQDLNRKFR
jgi:hypothetical protein